MSKDTEIEEVGLYVIKHKPSSSVVQVKCSLDKSNNPKLKSVEMLSGNVIPLHGIRNAFKQLKKKHGSNEPDQTA